MNEKCGGCPRLNSLRQERILSFEERIEARTGLTVTQESWNALGSINNPPISVRLADDSLVDRDIIWEEWHRKQIAQEAKTDAIKELTDDCPGMLDAQTSINEQTVTLQVCGKTALQSIE